MREGERRVECADVEVRACVVDVGVEIASRRCSSGSDRWSSRDSDSGYPHPLMKGPACRPVKHQQQDHGNYKGVLPRLHGMDALASPLQRGATVSATGAAGTGGAK